MTTAPTLPLTPDFARRLGVILASLAAVIARCLLRDPFRAPLIIPLWNLLTRAARRLDRAFARLAAGPLPAPKPRKTRSAGPRPRPVLPTRRGWLVAAIGYEAAGYASQLAALLAEPEAADALVRSLAARRALAPIRCMLGLTAPRRQQPRRRARPQPPPTPVVVRPTPPAWMREPPPTRTARPWWMPPRRRRRSGWPPPAAGPA